MKHLCLGIAILFLPGCNDVPSTEKWANASPITASSQLKGNWKATRIPEASNLTYWRLSFSESTVAESATLKSGVAVAPLWEYRIEHSHLYMRQPNDSWIDSGEVRMHQNAMLIKKNHGIYELE